MDYLYIYCDVFIHYRSVGKLLVLDGNTWTHITVKIIIKNSYL